MLKINSEYIMIELIRLSNFSFANAWKTSIQKRATNNSINEIHNKIKITLTKRNLSTNVKYENNSSISQIA